MHTAIAFVPSAFFLAMSIVAQPSAPEPRNGIQPSADPSVSLMGGNDLSIQGADIVPLSVERPTAGRIVIRGATYAKSRPDAPVIEGIPIALASMGWSSDPGGTIVYAVDPAHDYTISTMILQYTPDGNVDYDVAAEIQEHELPRSRTHKVQRLLQISIEAHELQTELGQISFLEYSEAIRAIGLEGETDAIPTGIEASEEHFRSVDQHNAEESLIGGGADAEPGSGAED